MSLEFFIDRLRYGLRVLVVALMTIAVTACVSVKSKPHERRHTSDGEIVECSRNFPEWQLEVDTYSMDACLAGGGGQAGVYFALGCLAVMGVFVPVGSTVISGSIYLVGNTLHWAERNVRCSAF